LNIVKLDWTDQQVETIVGQLLRIGVIVSATIVMIGGLIFLVRHGMSPANYRVFAGEPSELRTFRGIIRQTLALHGRGVIQLGLVLLIATPIARVAFSIFGFAAEKDRLYVYFTALVLIVLLYSLIGSA
jgi:uncharacterized membrane protein